MTSPLAPGGSRFIGRSDDLAALVGALDEALAGSTVVVLVEGEAGIGKTRLLEELARLADARLVPVAWGRSTTIEGAPPFWPWRQVLRACSIEWRSLGDHLGGSGDAGSASEDRFLLFEAAADALTDAGEANGLVVLLDDLQWTDLASLHLLHHLTQHGRNARLLIVGTLRTLDTPVTTDATFDDVLGAIQRKATTRLDLHGCDTDDLRAHLAEVLGSEPPPSLVQHLAAQTAGNPLFVREIGRILRARADPHDQVMPEAVRAVIRQRLTSLSDTTRSTLATAAVVGSDIDPRMIATISAQPLGAVIEQLAEAETGGVVQSSRGGAHPRFTHDLMREVAKDELGVSELAELHLRVADHLALVDGDHLAEVAHHRMAAIPLGDPAAAIADAVVAARAAMDQLAFENAAHLYDQATELHVEADLDEAARLTILLEAARAHHCGHDLEGAMRATRDAASIARRARNAAALAQAVLALQDVTEPTWIDEIEPWISESLALLPEEDSSVRSQLLAMEALIRVYRAMPGGEERSIQSIEMAERLDDVPALLAAYRARQFVLSGPEGTDERQRLAEQMIELGRRKSIEDATVWGHLWRFDTFVELGRIDDAEVELDELDLLANRSGKPHLRWHVDRGRVAVWIGRGRFADARQLGEQTGFLPPLGIIARSTGERMRPDLEEGLWEIVSTSPLVVLQRVGAAHYALAFGWHEKAAEIYASIPLPGTARLPRFLALPAHAFHVALGIAFEDRPAVEACYELLLPFRALHVASGAGVVMTRGSVEVPLGQAAHYLGRPTDAIAHLRAGLASNERAGLVPLAAEASYHLAVALLEQPSDAARAEAIELLRGAGATADRLRMAPLAEDVRAAAAAVAPAETGASLDPLSKREREIAALVGQGMTNRQIADTAHISERTAENHVQHILTKLGFQNRSQIAVWFTDQRR